MPRRRAVAVPSDPAAAGSESAAAPSPRKKRTQEPKAKRTPIEALMAASEPLPHLGKSPDAGPVLHDGARPNAFRTGVNIDALAGDALRTYARQIGLTQRDAMELSEDRLRMNCKARLFDMIETHLS